MHALREFALRAEPFGRLLAADGSVDRGTARSIFASFDRDGDGCIDPGAQRRGGHRLDKLQCLHACMPARAVVLRV